MNNVLVTSSGRRVELVQAFREALRDLNADGCVVTADVSAHVPTAYVSDGHFQLPHVHDRAFQAAILRLCRREGISLVIPTIDTELIELSRLRERLGLQQTEVVLSGLKTLRIVGDKRRSNQWLSEQGIAHAHQWDLDADLESSQVEYPVVVKPRFGSMSAGVIEIEQSSELDVFRASHSPADYVVESKLLGTEYTVSTYVDRDGRCLVTVPRQRLKVRGGEVVTARTVRVQVVEEISRQVVESLPECRGPINVQVMYDAATQSASVIEINARFGGGDPLAWRAGANIPRWILEEYKGQRISPLSTWEADLSMLRFDQSIYLKGSSQEHVSLPRWPETRDF